MRTYFTMLLLASVVSFLVTPLARRLAFFLGAIDQPDPRKIHRAPTPRLGGLAVVAGFCAPWAALYFLDNLVVRVFQQHEQMFFTLAGSGLVMFGVGVVDDIVGLSARRKLVFQVAVAVAMYYGGFRIGDLSNDLTGPLPLGWFSLPVTVLWIVGITNATNLLDGMDGLVAGVASVMALSLAMINILDRNIVVALLTFSLAGAALGFLPYNFTPARIFLGDSGSLFVGVVMAGISTLSLFKTATATLVLVPMLLLFALPLFDTTQVVIGRLRRGRHPFSPDKTHVHHRLLELGLNQRQAAVLLYILTIFLGVSAIVLSHWMTPEVVLTIVVIAGGLATGFVILTRRIARERRNADSPVK